MGTRFSGPGDSLRRPIVLADKIRMQRSRHGAISSRHGERHDQPRFKVPSCHADKDRNLLDGSNTYKLHLPAGIPVKLYWAVTIYNPVDGTMPQTDQPFLSRN